MTNLTFAAATTSGNKTNSFALTLRNVAFAMLGLCGINAVMPMPPSIASYFFPSDALWLIGIGALLVLSIDVPDWALVRTSWVDALCRARGVGGILAAVSALVAVVGGQFAFHGFALSRDEVMARFDASIFRQGHLLAEVPSQWRMFTAALEPRFVQDVPGGAAWVSSYLPVNALLRAGLDIVPGCGLANPILVAVSIVAVFAVARQLWPERRDAAVVAALLLATTPQMIVTAFTPYAMTGHMAFNLVWLWLFLRDRPASHLGAAVVGFAATGLHQLAFHPMFVCPFIIQLWLMRRWRLAAYYTIAYGAIGLFWLLYWRLLFAHYGVNAATGGDHGLGTFWTQVVGLVQGYDWDNVEITAKNLTRFLAWQNPMSIPLAALAIAGLRRWDNPFVAMVAGLVLTVVVLFVVMPSQGHGWGYRYVHGLLGSVCLLAAHGWVTATRSCTEPARRRLWTQLVLACVVAVAIMLPDRTIEARHFMAPFVSAAKAIESARTDLVLVDSPSAWFAEDLVRNDPYLGNRPLIMDLSNLDDAGLRSLCQTYSISLFGRHEAITFHLPLTPDYKPVERAPLKDHACGKPLEIAP